MSAKPIGPALLVALLAAPACGGEEEAAPLPNPVPTATAPVVPVQGERVEVTRVRPDGFEWPGGVSAEATEPGVVSVLYTLDNPCRHVPRGAQSSVRGDTVALVVRWPQVQPDSSRKCPPDVTPFAFRFDLDDLPSGKRTLAVFEAIEGQTAAALSYALEVTVR